MSKSLGNFVTVKDLRDQQVKGDAARLTLLLTSYRKPLDYNEKAVEDAAKTLDYWYRAIIKAQIDFNQIDNVARVDNIADLEPVMECLLEDLNTSKAIKLINDLAKQVHLSGDRQIARKMLSSARFLGLMSLTSKEWFDIDRNDLDENLIASLITQRTEAKKVKDWQEADDLRDRLTMMGVELEDKADGTTLWRIIKE